MTRRRRDNPLSLFSFQDIITGLCGIMIFMVIVQVVSIVIERASDAQSQSRSSGAQDDRQMLEAEIRQLEKALAAVKVRSARAVEAVKDKARAGDFKRRDEIDRVLTEKELVVAALVSQVDDLETQVEKAKKADAEDAAKVKEMERIRRLLEQQLADRKGRRGVTLIPERGEAQIPIYIICSAKEIEVHRPFENVEKVVIPREDMFNDLAEMLDGLDRTTHLAVLLVRPSGTKLMKIVVTMLQQRDFKYGRDPLEEDVEVAFEPRRAK